MRKTETDEQSECPICIEKLHENNKKTQVVCENKHQICEQCLDSLLSSKLSTIGCPSCRQPMNITQQRIHQARVRTGVAVVQESSSMFLNPNPGAPPNAAAAGVPVNAHTCSLLYLYPGLLAVLLVWGTAALNCAYFILLGGSFSFVLLYLIISQICQLYLLNNTWVAQYLCSERTKGILKQTLFFSMALNIKEKTVGSILFYLKEVVLVVSIAVIQFGIFKEWTPFTLIVFIANTLSLLFLWVLSMRIRDPVVQNWTSFLNNHMKIQITLLVFIVLINHVYIALWAYVSYQIHPLLMVGHFVLPLIQMTLAMEHYHQSRKSLWHMAYSLPYCYSYTIYSTGRLLRWLCFVQKYLEMPAFLAYSVMHVTEDCYDCPQPYTIITIAAYVLSLFSVIQVPIGGTLKAIAFGL